MLPDSWSGLIALVLMIVTIAAKVGAMRLLELRHVRQRALEHQRMELAQQLAALQGERELARRDQLQARQDVLALKDQMYETRADLEALEEEGERHRQRLARMIGTDKDGVVREASSLLTA